MSTSLIQTTGKGLYSPIENKHKEIIWKQINNYDTIYGQIGNTVHFAIDKYKNGYAVRHFVGRTVEMYGTQNQYKKLSTAKSVCTNLLRKEILKAVILLDNLANIKNIE